MNFDTKSATRLALIGLAAASLAACASRPKPTPVAPVEPAPSAPSTPYTPPPSPGVSQGAIPGSVQDFVINIGERVYFDTDEYVVRSDAQPVLAAQAQWLNRYQAVRVRIEGNADERGTREYNLALGARRAESIRNYLIDRGVPAGRIDTISFGKERPIAQGANEDAWARNRNGHTAIVTGAN